MKKLALIILTTFLLTGCITTNGEMLNRENAAAKSLTTMQSVIISTATTASQLCNIGIIGRDDCRTIEYTYNLAKPAYSLAADSLIVALTHKNIQTDWDRYQLANKEFLLIYSSMLDMAIKYKMLEGAR